MLKNKKLKEWLKSIRYELMRRRSYWFGANLFRQLYGIRYFGYAQHLEDMMLEQLFMEKLLPEKGIGGVYVDVGAHHPILISNTYKLYLRGWHGINIDPLPHSKEIFDKFRPKDSNLNIGIGSSQGSMEYYMFDMAECNTFNEQRAKKLSDAGIKLIEKKQVEIDTLEHVFDVYLKGEKIDVLTVDVETLELDVLKSNNWDKYRPRVIVTEVLAANDLRKVVDNSAVQYLIALGYTPIAKIFMSVFLLDNDLL